MLPRNLFVALTVFISVVWAGNVLVGFLVPDRQDPAINAIFAIVVGAVYALGRKDSAQRERDAAATRESRDDGGEP